jgi:serine/threonine protein kinase
MVIHYYLYFIFLITCYNFFLINKKKKQQQNQKLENTNTTKKNEEKKRMNEQLYKKRKKISTPPEVLLGKGSYGTVVKIQHHDKFIARKRLLFTEYEGINHSAVRECTFLNLLNHPCIYKHESFNISADGTVDIFMPLAKTNLHEWIQHTPPYTRYRHLPHMAYRLISALHYIHQLQIIHRDIKPDNILMDHQNNVFLADFGSSREVMFATSDLTINGAIPYQENLNKYLNPRQTLNMITYVYRPPEMDTEFYTTQADIYSLGCTLIQLVVGSYPKTSYASINTFALDTNNNDMSPHPVILTTPPSRNSDVPTPQLWQNHLLDYIQKNHIPGTLKPWIQLLLSMIRECPHSRPTAYELLLHKKMFKFPLRYVSKYPISRRGFYNAFLRIPSLSLLYQYLSQVCQFLKLSRLVYCRTVNMFHRFVYRHPPQGIMNFYHIALACLRLVCKMFTDQYPKMEDMITLFNVDGNEINRLEVYVFLHCGFQVEM